VIPRRLRSADLLASRKAWNPDIHINENGPETGFVLQYFVNEACVKGLKIRHVNNKWILFEVSEACD
jgi:hypothetical protein